MTSAPFTDEYAQAYDAFYADKDYEGECDLVEGVFRSYGDAPIRRILDLGCGTGGHSVPLARRGYEVIGVDRAAGMLERARRKSASSGATHAARFVEADIRSFNVTPPVDAILLLFAVLGYQADPGAALETLRNARSNLRAGGLLIGDVWFGPAVVAQRPSVRHRSVRHGDAEIVRVSSGRLDEPTQSCIVSMDFTIRQKGGRTRTWHEEHRVRYFAAEEIVETLRASRFDLVRLGAFPEIARDADASTWNAAFIARAL